MRRALLLLALTSIAAVGCSRGPRELTGTVTYRERMALPPDAVVEVTLETVATSGTPEVLGVARVGRATQVPIAYSIQYDPFAVDQERDYVVRARITAGGQLLFASHEGQPVLTRGHPATASLVLTRATEPAAPPLRGMFVYMADSPIFEPCGGQRRVPVAMEGDYLALERAYTTAGAVPGLPMLATVEGRIEERRRMEGEGTQPALVVTRFISISPTGTCGELPPVPPPG